MTNQKFMRAAIKALIRIPEYAGVKPTRFYNITITESKVTLLGYNEADLYTNLYHMVTEKPEISNTGPVIYTCFKDFYNIDIDGQTITVAMDFTLTHRVEKIKHTEE